MYAIEKHSNIIDDVSKIGFKSLLTKESHLQHEEKYISE